MKKWIAAVLIIPVLLALGCAGPAAAQPEESAAVSIATAPAPVPEATPEPTTEPAPAPTTAPTPLPDMTVTSAGITDGEMDLAYGAKGEQYRGRMPSRSLPLTVSFVPEGTAVLALTMIDPDGRDWIHWTACNIPVDGAVCEIAENASEDWPETILQGRSDYGPNGYGGPKPPSGVHTYVITVYALSEPLELGTGFRLSALQAAMEGKILGEAVLTGTYAK